MDSTKANVGYLNERRLWLLSLVIACVTLLLMLLLVGLLMRHAALSNTTQRAALPSETMVIAITPLPPTPPPAEARLEEKSPQRFARTSPDQASAPPEKADFIGDRDTIATSDALPAAGAPALPSQKGRDPRKPDDIETTESIPQDGPLEHDQVAQPSTPSSSDNRPTEQVAETMKNQPSTATATPPAEPTPPREELPKPTEAKAKNLAAEDTPTLPGNQDVERPMTEESIKPQKPEKMPDVATAQPPPSSLPKPTPPPTTPKEPGFRGNQSKTKITGSIKRQGRSALNVANTAMGRYHSKLSRAVEAEWHRNCAKYRDFITPGILTIRFVIDPSGSVRSVNVVEMIDAGEVQKGFTLNSIRQAKIPPIPADLKAEIEDDPIEITYNFYF